MLHARFGCPTAGPGVKRQYHVNEEKDTRSETVHGVTLRYIHPDNVGCYC